MTVNLAWPRAAVYDPAGGHWYFQWFTVLFPAAATATGTLCRVFAKRSPAAGRPDGPRPSERPDGLRTGANPAEIQLP